MFQKLLLKSMRRFSASSVPWGSNRLVPPAGRAKSSAVPFFVFPQFSNRHFARHDKKSKVCSAESFNAEVISFAANSAFSAVKLCRHPPNFHQLRIPKSALLHCRARFAILTIPARAVRTDSEWNSENTFQIWISFPDSVRRRQGPSAWPTLPASVPFRKTRTKEIPCQRDPVPKRQR